MRASDITACVACGKHPTKSGAGGGVGLTLYRVRAERHVLDVQAARSTLALDLHFGGRAPALAEALSPDPHVYKTSPELVDEVIVCEACAVLLPLAAVIEAANARKEPE